MKQPKPLHDVQNLPQTVTVDGKLYRIRWDFSAALRFMEYVDRSDDEDETFIRRVLELWYPEVPENTDEALTQAIRFYCGGDLPREGYYAPVFIPKKETQGIYRGFLERYGIDLHRDRVHWWVFRLLLEQFREGRALKWTQKRKTARSAG